MNLIQPVPIALPVFVCVYDIQIAIKNLIGFPINLEDRFPEIRRVV